MENLLDRILDSLKLSAKEFNSFRNKHSVDISNRSNFKDSLTKAKERLTSERDKISIPQKVETTQINYNWITEKNNIKTRKRYPPGTDLEKVNRKKELSREISLIDRMLQIVDLYPEKESSQIKEKESKSKYSEYGELNNLVSEFLDLPEFKSLNIPKHTTLKANHKISIEKILKEKFPDFPLQKFSSFLTKLKKADYSKSRDKNN